jgi:16S rRNA (guanine(1405)-N(7))-methyltransferase
LDIEELTDKVLESRKYCTLYRPTVKRIVSDLAGRYPKSEAEKAIKKRLHQIWGAYFTRPNYSRLLTKIREGKEAGMDVRTALLPILRLQTSTNERIPILDQFYSRIFSFTGIPKTILEPACGLNALSYFWMDSKISYSGVDVDVELIDFINGIYELFRATKARVKLGDILEDKFKAEAELVLLLKALPLLEHQKRNCSLAVLRGIKCKFLVVSFPTRSISGKDKGMAEFYTKYFQNLVKQENWQTKKLFFDSELVFIMRKVKI